MGVEENQGDLRVVRRVNGVFIALSPHGENTQDIPSADPGGGSWRKGGRYIRGVFYAGTGVGVVPSVWIPREGEQSRETEIILHVSLLEGEGVNYTGETVTNATLKSLWDAYDSGTSDETQTGIYM